MAEFLAKKCTCGDEPLFGDLHRLRLEWGLQAAAMANGVDPRAIGARSLRAGCAISLYIRGVSEISIQRFGWR